MRIKGILWLAVASLVPVMAMSSCANQAAAPPAQAPAPPAAKPEMRVAVTPADQATGLPLSTEIGVEISDGRVESVTLVDEKGQAVSGGMRPDGTSWVPDQPLSPDTRYQVTLVAKGGLDTKTLTSTFTTMPEPGNRVGTGLYLFDGLEYGQAMPVVVEFMQPVEPDARAGVEKRLFVTTEPHQPGVWHWMSGQQVTYRAEHYWQPGTTITVRAALDGQPFGGDRYGDQDRRATVRIAQSKVELFIDDSTKQMTVHRDGEVIRQMPVSLGKASTPSSSGTMVIMDKKAQTVFDTRGEAGDQYVADISYAQRLTWGGEFIHAAPWSVADQGVRNVSHGCVNMSWSDAQWLFSVTRVGDPVTVSGTGQPLAPGNGFTAWNLPWPEYVKGSALPGD